MEGLGEQLLPLAHSVVPVYLQVPTFDLVVTRQVDHQELQNAATVPYFLEVGLDHLHLLLLVENRPSLHRPDRLVFR